MMSFSLQSNLPYSELRTSLCGKVTVNRSLLEGWLNNFMPRDEAASLLE